MGAGGYIAYGNAKPTDTHLLSKVHCTDDGIFKDLAKRERRNKQVSQTQGKAERAASFHSAQPCLRG